MQIVGREDTLMAKQKSQPLNLLDFMFAFTSTVVPVKKHKVKL